jgi:hypothetical protein
MNDNELFSDFKNNSAIVMQNKVPLEILNSSTAETISKMKDMKKLEDMELFLQNCSLIKEGYELIKVMALLMIDQQGWFKFVGYSSIYKFCQKRQGVFHLSSTSSISTDLRCAKTLFILVNNNSVSSYLENHGEKTGRGFKDSNGNWKGFKIADFMGYKSKLALLFNCINQYHNADIDFEVFFDSTVKEYEEYLKENSNFKFPTTNSHSPNIPNNARNTPAPARTLALISAPTSTHAFTSNPDNTQQQNNAYQTRIRAFIDAVLEEIDPFAPARFSSIGEFYSVHELQKPLDQYANIEEMLEELDPFALTTFSSLDEEDIRFLLKPLYQLVGKTKIERKPQLSDALGSDTVISAEPLEQDPEEITIESEPQRSVRQTQSHLPNGILKEYYLFRLLPPSDDFTNNNNVLQMKKYIETYLSCDRQNLIYQTV